MGGRPASTLVPAQAKVRKFRGQVDPPVYQFLHSLVVTELLADGREVLLLDKLRAVLASPGEADLE